VHKCEYTAVLSDAGIARFVDKYGNDLANGPPLEKFKLKETVTIEELNAQHGVHPTADDFDSPVR
jgi:hypothetical protein